MKWLSLWRKRSKNQATEQASARQSERNKFRAVAIAADLEGGCTAWQQQDGERYLMHEAPELPLAQCDAAKCNCRYVRFEDRREEARRDADVGIGERPHLADERRSSSRDRRSR